MIKRQLENNINKELNDQKVIILLGARQVGKTTLLQQYKSDGTLWLNADEIDVREQLQNKTSTALKQFIGNHNRVIIDEAQRVENIGLTLKLLHDNYPHIKLLVSGSSAFELANKIKEPLTGRKWEHTLFPLSTHELIEHHGIIEEKRLLEHRLIYGFYPEVINRNGQEQKVLKELTDSYLYKDVLLWENIKKPQKLEKLLQALALQIGNEISYNELANLLQLDHQTVQRYIELLEKTFVVFTLPAFSRNLRTELKKSRKVYFYDLGIRNAVINQWKTLNLRQDTGALWENFLIVERMKYRMNHQLFANQYFWRTHAQQEIDFIEDYNGILHAFEFKWNPKKHVKPSKTFTNTYPEHTFQMVNRENYLDFIHHKDV